MDDGCMLRVLRMSTSQFSIRRMIGLGCLVWLAWTDVGWAQQGSAVEVFRLGNRYFAKGDLGRAATCYQNVLTRLRGEGAEYNRIVEASLANHATCLFHLQYY